MYSDQSISIRNNFKGIWAYKKHTSVMNSTQLDQLKTTVINN